MKIVHLMGYFVPELGYQEYYLAKKHKQMGHDVYVIASDLLYPFPNIETMLKEAGIKPGFCVLDYGCGPGGYVADASRMAGETGKIYALDIHPLAARMVENNALKKLKIYLTENE